MELILKHGSALVDDDCAELIKHFRWTSMQTQQGRVYAYATVAGHRIYMHHLVLNHTPRGRGGGDIDHINGDGLDNRRANLRKATRSQNNANKKSHKGSTSQYKGVSWDRRSRTWAAHIKTDKRRFLGCYELETDAAHAHDLAAVEGFGEYARINLPDRIHDPAPVRFSALLIPRDLDTPTRMTPPPEDWHHGPTNPNAKLSEDDVRAIIRELLVVPRRTQASIAADFGVSQPMVGHIKNRRAWAYLWD